MANVLKSKRVQVLGVLMLASGMPLGFVFNTFQIFLRSAGVDLKTIGILSAVSLPWSLKFLWAPLVDRYALPRPDRRRSWIVVAQIALALGFFAFAAYAGFALERDAATGRMALAASAAATLGAIALFITLASATQDIALDAYSVEVLEPEEQGPASGLRVMWYRIGMLIAGALAIFSAQWLPWPAVFALLGVLFLASIGLTLWADPPARPASAPRSLAAAVVEPFRTYFGRPQALTVAAFLVLYKFGDNAAGTMVNPFLKDMCFSNAEIGLAVKVIGTAATIAGTGVGAALMSRLGLGRALWVFGVAQAGAIGFYALAAAARAAPLDVALCATLEPISALARGWTYVGIAAEYASQGMGTAALLALILRVCDKRYSATQYALLSSLFGFGRTLSGIPSGFLAERLGYSLFFVSCIALAIPGFLVLQRLAPLHQRDVLASQPAGGTPA
ncbi:MFS transporter [Anaeromyxobacter sp. Fw109-5]|uniref:MFS transporter n=1 Tax=Anaeromyxobacter sp. (strain Fw109-5) TaxID=404589 RepID=UPI0000ED8150|nr:MFS transporter [Anaeromyxobacter sp. Fw109-5]ABS25507.1 major facilitator superfamily MFS_1 [Anaeromyxobacter sp. Fw109-5]